MPFARIALDVHLHFYPCYDETKFLDALCANLDHDADATSPLEKMVLLTEAAGCDTFSRWSGQTCPGPAGYAFTATAEPHSLALTRAGKRLALICAGRQIVTAERLEVLTAGSRLKIPDGLPLAEVVAELTAAAELAIIPWGAGKWLGRRGRLVQEVMQSRQAPTVFLADNPARPAWWPVPRVFQMVLNQGGSVLHGSDPLPFPGEENHAGGFATLVAGDFDPALPLASLKTILATGGPWPGVGRRDGFFTFFKRQIRLRL